MWPFVNLRKGYKVKKKISDHLWFPLWVDKWIFGSTRIECTLEERAIWIDFLALASKDNGYIRANETIAYPLELLAGLLFIPLEILKKAIKKFEETGKIRIDQNGSIYVISWNEYQLSNSYKRVIKHRVTKLETDNVSSETNSVTHIISKQNKSEQIIKDKKDLSKLNLDFSLFYQNYPKHEARKKALNIWLKLKPNTILLNTILAALEKQKTYKKTLKARREFCPEWPLPAVWLNQERWNDEIKEGDYKNGQGNWVPKEYTPEQKPTFSEEENIKKIRGIVKSIG